MASTLPDLSYTTPEEFVNYYYEKLKTDLSVYDLQISKVGFVGYFLNLLGYTHFDLKQYYDSLFKESFVGTSQTEESQYLHASNYGYIPTFANAANATGTLQFDMINWLPRRQSDVVRREVIVGYDTTSGVYTPLSSTFKLDDIQFSIDSIYKFVEIEDNGAYYYYTDIITSDGTKITLPSSSFSIIVPLYSTTQYTKKEISFEIKPYNFGSYQTYYFGIDSGYYLSDLEVYVTEVGSSIEEQYTVKYTKYLEKGSDKSVFLRKVTSVDYVIEFGSGVRGKWISGASIRIIIKSCRGTAGNLIDKTNQKLQITGNILAFDYIVGPSGLLTSINPNPSVMQQPLVDFDYAESGLDPLSGEDLRDAIVNFIQTRENLVSQQDFYNIAVDYFDDFKFLFKKFNVYDNIFHLCRSFRDRNQTIFYTTNHTEQIMNLKSTADISYGINATSLVGTGTLISGWYGYFVVSIDEWGSSAPSKVVQIFIDNTAGENSVTITFDKVPYASTYRVYGRSTTFRDQYWEISASDPQPSTYSIVDDGSDGISDIEPTSYEFQELYYRPTFTIEERVFISPYVFKGNTRMNYYDGYLMKDLSRIEFSEILPDSSTLGSGFDIPMVYLNLEYDESSYTTVVMLKSYQTIGNLVFTISVFGENFNITGKRMTCFPLPPDVLSPNYFIYEYTNADTFGIFEKEIQMEIKGGTSNSIITNNTETYTIGVGEETLNIKFNDISEGYTDPFIAVTLTTGSVSANQIVTDINTAIGLDVASIYTDDDGNGRVHITPPSATVTNIFISETSTCLFALGLTGSDVEPATLNGPMTSLKFVCRTDKFYQLIDTSDQLKLMRYNSGSDSYIINVPVVDNILFQSDPDYYLDKIKNFIVDTAFNENRMITDNVQCRFLNSYILESPFIESAFVQSGEIFSNIEYVFLGSVIETRDYPPIIALDGSRYRVSTTPVSGSGFEGHENEIASYTSGPPEAWEFYSPIENDFILDINTNIYYRWNSDILLWDNIPKIILPLHMKIEAKADKTYTQKNNIDIATERENLTLSIAEFLQKGFSGSNIIFYNSLITEFVHTGRAFIKSVKVYVTDSSNVPNEMDNGIEVKSDNDIFAGLKDKLDIVKYVPPMIYWDVDNIDVIISVE